jgi:hypothetical protein
VYPEHGIERKPVPGVKLSPIQTARRLPRLEGHGTTSPKLSCFVIWNQDTRLVKRKGMGDLVKTVERLEKNDGSSQTLVPDATSEQENT